MKSAEKINEITKSTGKGDITETEFINLYFQKYQFKMFNLIDSKYLRSQLNEKSESEWNLFMFKLELKKIISSITIDLKPNFKFNLKFGKKNEYLNYVFVKNLIKKGLVKEKVLPFQIKDQK